MSEAEFETAKLERRLAWQDDVSEDGVKSVADEAEIEVGESKDVSGTSTPKVRSISPYHSCFCLLTLNNSRAPLNVTSTLSTTSRAPKPPSEPSAP